MPDSTYLQRIRQTLENNRAIAWIVLAFVVTGAIIGFVNSVLPLIERLRISEGGTLHINLSPDDPRTTFEGESQNWGGGSQAVFLGGTKPAKVDGGYDGSGARSVWEAPVFGNAIVRVAAEYKTRGGEKCHVERWLVKVVPAEASDSLSLAAYVTGGADAVFSGAETSIGPKGEYPLRVWLEQDEEQKRPPARYQYLGPNERSALRIWLNTPPPADARRALDVCVCADVIINGERKRFESKEHLRMVVPSTADISQLEKLTEEHAGEQEWSDFIEDLKREAYYDAHK